MSHALYRRFDRLIGLDGQSEEERVLVSETLNAIIPRMPWLYAILIVNLSGLLLALKQHSSVYIWMGAPLLLLLAWRLFHWWRIRSRAPGQIDAARELRRLYLIGLVVCFCYSVWSIIIYTRAPFDDRTHLIVVASLASLCCSFALSPFPVAARVPLYVMSLPLALLLGITDHSHLAVSLTLVTLVFVSTKLIDEQYAAFSRLVHTRFRLEAEKFRAEQAERNAVEERLHATQMAYTDALTGLGNRRALLAEIDRRNRVEGGGMTVVLLDLDGFKAVNDTFGHDTGDSLLIAVARRLTRVVGRTVFAARLGGDEFALLLPTTSGAAAIGLVEVAVERLGRPYPGRGRKLVVSACGGIAVPGEGGADSTQLIRMADIALFAAKRAGRGRLEVFSSELEKDIRRRAEIEVALRASGVENEIDVAFQPIFDLSTMTVGSFEALARWRHSELGWIPPSEFIPITEQISVVGQINDCLLRRAAAEAATWPSNIRLSFNLSAVQLCSNASAERVIAIVNETGLDPARLQIEVTETALLVDFDAARRNLSYLRRNGVQLVLDDFGAGYASISYMREMQFDAIKLDGSLITAAAKDSGGFLLLKGVLDLCRAVGLPCVAEHVETETQAEMLLDLGCRYGQGYWLARPMSAQSAAQLAESDLIQLGPARTLKQRSAAPRRRA